MKTGSAAVLVLLAACGQEKSASQPEKQPAPPGLAGQIELPIGDGRIYLLKNPDPLGFEVGTCFLHVGPSGANAIACMPPRIEFDRSKD